MFWGDAPDETTAYSKKFWKLNKALAELIDKFSQVGFIFLDIKDKMNMANLVMRIDKANDWFDDPEKT